MPHDPWSAKVADPWAASLAARRVAPRPPGTWPAAERAANAWQDYRQAPRQAPRHPAASPAVSQQHAQGFGQGWVGGGGGQRRFKFGPRGERLEVINWQGLEIVPVQKDFSFEHPAVALRSEEECEAIRARNSIHVLRPEDYVPRPVSRLEEAPFPDWAAAELRRSGFERPTPLQVQAWPAVLRGHDFVGIVERGGGKAIAYVLPMLVHLTAQPELKPGEGPIGLVLVPTRELCQEVARQVEAFAASSSVACRALHGGEEVSPQERAVLQHVDVVVATPGRLIALLNNRATNLRRATFVVLDEADELLDQGFGEQVRLILGQVRPDRQALLFSATWPVAVEALAGDVCTQRPIHVNVGSVSLSACKTVLQRLLRVGHKESKNELLCLALDQIRSRLCNDGQRALVFCNRSCTAEYVVEELQQRGYPCEGFRGQAPQAERQELLRRFAAADGGLWLLVCTQLLGRGHELPGVGYVINYDTPTKVTEYVHRIGRICCPSQRGFSLTFVSEADHGVSKAMALVLRECHQEVPDWLGSLGRQHWRGGYQAGGHGQFWHGRKAKYAPPPEPAASVTDSVAVEWRGWSGRGRGRRATFLGLCRGRGAARAAPPGLEAPPEDFPV